MATLMMASGNLVDPLNIDFSLVSTFDFCHALSIINRYTGNSKRPYSVAEHTVHLARKVPNHLRRAAIIHDFSECLVSDLPNPVKMDIPEYRTYEEKVIKQIADHYEVHEFDLEELKSYDRRACADEMRYIMARPFEIDGLEPLGFMPQSWDWKRARRELVSEAKKLGFDV